MLEWWEHVKDASLIDEGLYLGNWNNGANLAHDNPLGIQAVLNLSTTRLLTNESEPYLESSEIHYLHVPFPDEEPIPYECFWKCMNYLQYRHGSLKQKVLVHCNAGISRSPTIVASYLYLAAKAKVSDPPNWDSFISAIKISRNIVNPAVATRVSAKKLLQAWPYSEKWSF
jgi:hypothetical protein